ncbi:MAG: tail fiber domain-containing protein [Saprospiraceae bacterium]
MKFFILSVFLWTLPFVNGFSQGISISADGTPADSSAILDIKSSSQGILLPRTSSEGRYGILNPAQGLVLFDTTTNTFWYYTGTLWSDLAERLRVWSTYGNTDTDPEINFIGTTDTFPLRFRLNNTWAGELDAQLRNYFLGDSSGISNTTGIKNVGIGSLALPKNTQGSWNTSVGAESLYANTTGSYNVAVGFSALDSNTVGSENTAFGTKALRSNLSGSYNTASGVNSLYSNTTGGYNTANGAYVLFKNTSGSQNTASGYYSLLFNKTGYGNTVYGTAAMIYNTTGYSNTAIGSNALFYGTTGYYNTGIGMQALLNNRTSNYNTAVGAFSLPKHLTNDYITAVGSYALFEDTSGIANTAIGYGALMSNLNGGYNTSVGYLALQHNTTGYSNTSEGYASLYNNTTGYQNTAIGYGALNQLVGGHDNVSIGYESGIDPGSPFINNSISIGNMGYLNAANNQVFLGNLSSAWIGGNVTWSTYSDSRVKTNIKEDVKGLEFITRLRPVTYHRNIKAMSEITGNADNEDYPGKYDIEKIKFSGFLAQDVEVAAAAAGYDFSGITIPKSSKELYTLSYEQFVVPLVKATQELNTKVEQLQKKNEQLKTEMNSMIARIESLERKNN